MLTTKLNSQLLLRPLMKKHVIAFSAIVGLVSTGVSQASYDEQITSACNVGLTVTNVGTFGNAFRGNFDLLGSPSCEYPRNSGVEHLFEAGFWIGASVGGQFFVSTSAYDQSAGYSTGRAGYEFTPEIGSSIAQRSSLINSPNFNPQAVSHQDFIMDFSDKNLVVPGTNIQINDHTNPLNLSVHLESYNWNYAFSDFFVILNYEITNTGSFTLDSLHFGFWANGVVRNVNVTPAGQGGAAFYDKGGNGYIDSLNMAYVYDATGDVGFTESYFAHKFLGAEDKTGFLHPQIDTSFKARYQTWIFNNASQPLFFFPTSELERYRKMTIGLNENECWTQNNATNPNCGALSLAEQVNKPGNRSDLVSVGPFATLEPGESIKVSYALVLAKKNEDGLPNTSNNATQQQNLITNAGWAQTAFNGEDVNFNGILDEGEDKDGNGEITRFILPTPPEIPHTKIVARDGAVDIYWSNNSEASIDPISKIQDFEGYRIYISKLGFDVQNDNDVFQSLGKLAEYDLPNNGLFFETGLNEVRLEQPQTFENDSITYYYKYTLNNVINGWQYAIAVTSFDQGNEQNNLQSLESAPLANLHRVFPGKPANEALETNQPFAYPNPYYAGASWEGNSAFEEDRKLTFANLPERCYIRIFSAAGDLIDEIYHDASTYSGDDSRWYTTYSDVTSTVFSGGEHSWDLLSQNAQIIARGIYMFSVEDVDTGKIQKGKFVVIK